MNHTEKLYWSNHQGYTLVTRDYLNTFRKFIEIEKSNKPQRYDGSELEYYRKKLITLEELGHRGPNVLESG